LCKCYFINKIWQTFVLFIRKYSFYILLPNRLFSNCEWSDHKNIDLPWEKVFANRDIFCSSRFWTIILVLSVWELGQTCLSNFSVEHRSEMDIWDKGRLEQNFSHWKRWPCVSIVVCIISGYGTVVSHRFKLFVQVVVRHVSSKLSGSEFIVFNKISIRKQNIDYTIRVLAVCFRTNQYSFKALWWDTFLL